MYGVTQRLRFSQLLVLVIDIEVPRCVTWRISDFENLVAVLAEYGTRKYIG